MDLDGANEATIVKGNYLKVGFIVVIFAVTMIAGLTP